MLEAGRGTALWTEQTVRATGTLVAGPGLPPHRPRQAVESLRAHPPEPRAGPSPWWARGVCVVVCGESVGVCPARAHTRSLCQRRVPNTFSFLAIRLRLRKPLP